jgi:hypothetical protein
MTSLSELDYIDVFDFFNYPKVMESAPMPHGPAKIQQGHAFNGVGGDSMRAVGVPDPDSDWLGFGSPYS